MNRFGFHLVIGALALLLGGCGGTSRQEPADTRPAPAYVPLSDPRAVQAALFDQYQAWRGVPYRYGGSDRNGLDCSAFTQLTYRQRFGILLPRDTTTQRAAGSVVSSGAVAPGDLVFFSTGVKDRHVGIYYGDQRFLHVSERAGVTLSSMESGYWADRFRQAIRVALD